MTRRFFVVKLVTSLSLFFLTCLNVHEASIVLMVNVSTLQALEFWRDGQFGDG